MLLSFLRCRDCANKNCKMVARRLIMMFLAIKAEKQSPHSTSYSHLLFKCLYGDGNRLWVVIVMACFGCSSLCGASDYHGPRSLNISQHAAQIFYTWASFGMVAGDGVVATVLLNCAD